MDGWTPRSVVLLLVALRSLNERLEVGSTLDNFVFDLLGTDVVNQLRLKGLVQERPKLAKLGNFAQRISVGCNRLTWLLRTFREFRPLIVFVTYRTEMCTYKGGYFGARLVLRRQLSTLRVENGIGF